MHPTPANGPPERSLQAIDRRRVDRRRSPTPMWSRYWLRGRRRGSPGRLQDRVGVYVDCYPVADWLLVISVLTLQLTDCAFTLYWLSRGAIEANPLMAGVLREAGPGGFVAAKFAIALSTSAFLLLHIRFRWVRAALWIAAILYGLVAVWHLVGLPIIC